MAHHLLHDTRSRGVRLDAHAAAGDASIRGFLCAGQGLGPRLPAGKGYRVASAIRLAWALPA
jgi:hypothetical protein